MRSSYEQPALVLTDGSAFFGAPAADLFLDVVESDNSFEVLKVDDLLDDDAIDLVAERLRTPLQIEMHLTLAFEQGFRLGAKPVTADIVEQVLSRAIDDLEPTLTRNGYDAAALQYR